METVGFAPGPLTGEAYLLPPVLSSSRSSGWPEV